ncbi:MAG TPA: flagellar export chaperone FliS [Rhodocyclaceae bacterium]|nr:flagellar export chaperone FliS [Rhodocyclaceae bacterium]HNH35028.1 flagellar export chaperone FliS [Rhodocyclaceae bacterium]
MFTSMSTSPSAAYAKVGIETGVIAADPHKLILMLFDGALLAISSATVQMRGGETPEKGKSISKAIEIIDSGLKASLDFATGGELAARLGALYDYMCARLLFANLHNNEAALREVAGLLQEIKGAWEEIARDPAVLSGTPAAA